MIFNHDGLNAAFAADKNKVCGFTVTLDDDKCNKCHGVGKNGIIYLCMKHYMACNSAMMTAAAEWGRNK